MKDKTKNIITNILSLVFSSLSVYEYFTGRDYKMIVLLLLISAILFYVKSEQSRNWLGKFINKKIG